MIIDQHVIIDSGVQPVHLLDLDHLNKGMYALRILTKNGPSIVKFIID